MRPSRRAGSSNSNVNETVNIMAILFVCLGNICRSPTAEAVFRTHAPDIRCDSAGTAHWHIGKPPYAPMQEAARANGVDMSDLRARQFTRTDFGSFDQIFGMDARNLEDIELMRPAGSTTPVRNLASLVGREDVPDPYFTRDFDAAFDIVTRAIRALVAELQSSRI